MNKHIKDKVKSAFSAETPDVLENVIDACKNQEQLLSSQSDLFEKLPAKKFNLKRLILICSFILLFGIGIFTGINLAGVQKPAVAETVIYIDTLASVEISVDKNDKVIDCKPLNQNAQTVVEGINFSGMEVNATVNVILSSIRSIKVVPSNRDGSKIIYLIELERIADQDVERFEVNCETGEVFFASSQGHSLRFVII